MILLLGADPRGRPRDRARPARPLAPLRTGTRACALLLAHTVLITAGYTVGDRMSLWSRDRAADLDGYPGVITAIAGLVVLIGVVVSRW